MTTTHGSKSLLLFFFRKEGLPFTLLLIAAALYFSYCFASIPVNTEARDYIFQAGMPGRYHLWTLLFPNGNNAGAVSMLVFGATRRACGFSSRCLNAIQILQLLTALADGTWHLQQLIRRPVFVALAMLFWCASLPVFQAGFWQATQHDKLAFAFSLVALAILFRAIRGAATGGIVRVNAVLTLLFALAFNAKEAAFLQLYRRCAAGSAQAACGDLDHANEDRSHSQIRPRGVSALKPDPAHHVVQPILPCGQ